MSSKVNLKSFAKGNYENSEILNVINVNGKVISLNGVCAVKKIMMKNNLPYDTDLYNITSVLQNKYSKGELFDLGLATTGQILEVVKYIKEKQMLEL